MTTMAFARAYGPLTVSGLQVGGGSLDVTVRADGSADVSAPEGLTVLTG
ncbi:hypothetical protein [Streptomyces sp. NPDC087437]